MKTICNSECSITCPIPIIDGWQFKNQDLDYGSFIHTHTRKKSSEVNFLSIEMIIEIVNFLPLSCMDCDLKRLILDQSM